MVLLQIANDTLNTYKSIGAEHNFWFIIEIILILCVIIYQLYHSRNVYLNIEKLKSIFKHRIDVKSGYIEKVNLSKKEKTLKDIVFFKEDEASSEDDLFSDQKIVKISITETSGEGIITRIKDDINNYLLNNYGAAVNFSIIKDIIDREVDVKDEEISHSIPTPLYLGLAATMLGIIFGLWSMPELSGNLFSKGIDSLITGVKFAMIGSLTGLACTTILSSIFYKNAKKILLEQKNKQISHLQAKLLPELIRAEETGVSGLKASIDRFARDTTGMATILYNTTIKTESNLKIQNDIIQTQKEIIQKIDNIDITKVSKINLDLLFKLDNSIQSFNTDNFAKYLNLMSHIANQLQDFATRTSNVDNVITQIDNSLSDNVKLMRFLSGHFEKIEQSGNTALAAVNYADSHFRQAIQNLTNNMDEVLKRLFDSITDSNSKFAEAIDNLNVEINNRISKLNDNASTHEVQLTNLYDEIGKKLDKVTKEHLQTLQDAYNDAIPKFNQLDNLNLLPNIIEVQNDSNSKKIIIIDSVNHLNDSLNKVKNLIDNQSVLSKLTSIEENLKKNGRDHRPTGNMRPTKPIEVGSKLKENDLLSIGQVLKTYFNR